MGGRGLRCRKSGSLGEPRSGRQDCSPGHGWGALVWGGLKVAPSGSVGGLGSLGRTTWKSERLGALCRRQPSPVVRGECSGTEEPGRGDLPARTSAPCGEGTLLQLGRSGMVPTWGEGVYGRPPPSDSFLASMAPSVCEGGDGLARPKPRGLVLPDLRMAEDRAVCC